MQLPSPQTFNAFDWFLVALLALSTILALLRGIIRVLFSFVGLIAGISLAGWYYRPVAHWLTRWVTSQPAADVAAFLLIALAVMILFSLVGRLTSRSARRVGLGLVDRLLGGLFGFARGCLLGVAMMMTIAAFLPGSTIIRTSRLAPYFLDGAHAVSFVVPHDLHQRIQRGVEELKHNAPDWIKPGRSRHNGLTVSDRSSGSDRTPIS
jgi:membrane protein required for colicin V production